MIAIDKKLFPLFPSSCGTSAAMSTENNDNDNQFQRLIQLSTSTQSNDNENHYYHRLIGQLAPNCSDLIVFGVSFGTANNESKLHPQRDAMYNEKRSKM